MTHTPIDIVALEAANASLRALLAEAGEALEQFSYISKQWPAWVSGKHHVQGGPNPTVGDLRRAASTLAAIQTALREVSPTMGKAEMTISSEQAKTPWQDLLEKDDRTSPAEYHDMALITFEEFVAAELRGRIVGLLEALEMARAAFYTPDVIRRIRARLASLQPEVAKREEGG